jgi:hypothetical protein
VNSCFNVVVFIISDVKVPTAYETYGTFRRKVECECDQSPWALDVSGLPQLRCLEVRRAPRLDKIEGLGELSALTKLLLQDVPLGAGWDGKCDADFLRDLARLTQLRDLRLCRAPRGLHRMPSAVCALAALTSLELGMRLHDHTRYGALAPEKVAPLGGSVPAALGTDADADAAAAARVEHAPLMCLGLRRLIVRGSRGQLHLPEGLERFTALENSTWAAARR